MKMKITIEASEETIKFLEGALDEFIRHRRNDIGCEHVQIAWKAASGFGDACTQGKTDFKIKDYKEDWNPEEDEE